MSVKKSFEEIAKSMGLMEMSTARVIDLVKDDILMSLYRPNAQTADHKALNAKIAKVYQEWHKTEFSFDPHHKILSMFLMGPPGQGKTTTFKVAAKEVADALELDFHMNPDDTYKAKKNDFLFVSLECSGENSTITFGGLPSKVTEEGPNGPITYMTKVPNKRMALLSQVAGGLLLLDDFSNAAPNVQNVALSITDEKRFQGLSLENTYVGLTGNLGALDGTHTTKLSAALRGRCVTFFTKDELRNFEARVNNRYKDDIGDAQVMAFLQRNPECFAEMPETKKDGGYPSPRTWDHFISETRSFIRRNGGRGKGERESLENIKTYASIILGPEVGQKLQAYFYSLVMGADPLAQKAILQGKLDKEELKNKYGGGKSAPQQDFGYQFAVACADYTVQLIKNDKNHKIDVPIKRFGDAVLNLNPSEFAYAIDYLKNKMAVQVDQYCGNKDTKELRKTLHSEIKLEICKVLSTCTDFDNEARQVLIDAISDFDKLDNARRTRRLSR